jgi:hypothetical protein
MIWRIVQLFSDAPICEVDQSWRVVTWFAKSGPWTGSGTVCVCVCVCLSVTAVGPMIQLRLSLLETINDRLGNITMSWNSTSCSLVGRHQSFLANRCRYIQDLEDGDSRFLRNLGANPSKSTASNPGKLWSY